MSCIFLVMPLFRFDRATWLTASKTIAIISVMVTGSSYSFAQPPQGDKARSAAEICGGLSANAAVTTSFTAGGYDVQVSKNNELTIQKDGRVFARLPMQDYARFSKCVEEVGRALTSRPPGPIDPGGTKGPR